MDLTGFWTGSYWYYRGGTPVVPFLANIDDQAGSLSGKISEPDLHFGSGMRLEAVLIGQLDGSHVTFAKAYDGAGPFAHRVDYSGAVSGDGSSIKGTWRIANEWGGFEMSRELITQSELAEDSIEIEDQIAKEVR